MEAVCVQHFFNEAIKFAATFRDDVKLLDEAKRFDDPETSSNKSFLVFCIPLLQQIPADQISRAHAKTLVNLN